MPRGLRDHSRRRGQIAPPTSRNFASEPYFANHLRFFWREDGARYVATLHDFGKQTRQVLDALVQRLRSPDELDPDPRPLSQGVELLPSPVPAPVAVATTRDAIWLAGKGGVRGLQWPAIVPLDPESGEPTDDPIQITEFLSPPSLAAADGVWVAQAARTKRESLQLLDPGSARFVRSITAGSDLTAVAATGREVWTADLGGFPGDHDYRGGFVRRFDAQTGRLLANFRVGRAPAGVAIAETEQRAWVTNSLDDTVSVIDLRTNRFVDPVRVCSEPTGIDSGYGAVWVACHGADAVARIDAGTHRVREIEVGDGPRGVVTGKHGVWVANNLADTVSRIDPEEKRVIETTVVGAGPSGITVGHGAVWVATTYDDAVSRIAP